MRINDRIYGEADVTEPVLVELIESPVLQRLKGIDQAGYFEPHFPGTAHTRFEHSIGVMLLLRRYQADIAEQIAGLIHDASHSVFSHSIDYVVKEGNGGTQNHQDNFHEEFVKKSEIPAILKKHGFDVNFILDDSNFPLKEKELPNLCADRLDYSLRGAVVFGDLDEADQFLNSLRAENGQWFFSDLECARSFARLFKYLNDHYYSGLPTAIMFRSVGDYLKHSLDKGYIDVVDLYTTDSEVLAKIAPHHQKDERLALLFERMNNRVTVKEDPDDYDAEVVCKNRMVDPVYLENGKIQKFSDSDASYAQELLTGKIAKKHFIKFEK